MPMDITTVMLIAVGLAMDAFALSIAHGMTATSQKRKNALIMASSFSVFQMLMPLVGWLAGLAMAELIMGIDHWIAFSLLTFIGARMSYESTQKQSHRRNHANSHRNKNTPRTHHHSLITQTKTTTRNSPSSSFFT